MRTAECPRSKERLSSKHSIEVLVAAVMLRRRDELKSEPEEGNSLGFNWEGLT